MSLCDRCTNPGQCCSGFPLNGPVHETALEALVWLATVCTGTGPNGVSVKFNGIPPDEWEDIWVGLPFMPLFKGEEGGWPGDWRYWCQYLGRDGRCTIYEHRPALCRVYEAGSCRLCAMHGQQEALNGEHSQ